MPLCRTGRHSWTDSEDAAKCCDPAWRRVLVVGRDAVSASQTPLSVDAASGQVYGRRWERVARSAAAASPAPRERTPPPVRVITARDRRAVAERAAANATKTGLSRAFAREQGFYERLGLCPRCHAFGPHRCPGASSAGNDGSAP